jgi:DNA replication protein DnaC
MTTPTPTVDPELKTLMRRLKLGRLLDTLPERLALARQHDLTHTQFLEQLFSDEVQRRDSDSAGRRARVAKLDPSMTLDEWDDTAAITYDRATWTELVSMRFVEQARNAFILGPVGVGKTFLATALGHIACRRRIGVHFERGDKLHKRLKAARLDASYDAEMRKLIGVDLLVIDDFALQPLDATETADFYELCVERHRRSATVLTSNRDPSEWLAVMANPMLAQSAVDRLKSAAWELVIEGESYRQHEKPSLATPDRTRHQHLDVAALDTRPRRREHHARPVNVDATWSHASGNRVVPSDWQATPVLVVLETWRLWCLHPLKPWSIAVTQRWRKFRSELDPESRVLRPAGGATIWSCGTGSHEASPAERSSDPVDAADGSGRATRSMTDPSGGGVSRSPRRTGRTCRHGHARRCPG